VEKIEVFITAGGRTSDLLMLDVMPHKIEVFIATAVRA
jgi:hypothetical protein